MGNIISFGVQKGGTGKTMTTGMTAWILANVHNKKTLAIDFDSQGNLTQLLTTKDCYEFRGSTILEAIQQSNIEIAIHPVSEYLHLCPAHDHLVTLSRWLYESKHPNKSAALKLILAPVRELYDYILIDLPPNLGEQTVNGLTASDYAVAVFQTDQFCYSALERYFEIMEQVQGMTNQNLRVAGILTTMLQRTNVDTTIVDMAKEEYGDIIFKTVITRQTKLREFSMFGISRRTAADRNAMKQYEDFVEELIERVEEQHEGAIRGINGAEGGSSASNSR